jgi:hypothetical protein
MRQMVESQVHLDDILICYLKGPVKLIGALRVTDKPYFTYEPRIWASYDFPVRVPVEPVIVLESEMALDFRNLIKRLSTYNPDNMNSTWARFQGSPTLLNAGDGRILFDALKESQKSGATNERPSDVNTARGRQRRKSVREPVQDRDNPTLLATQPERLIREVLDAQRDAARPARFEHAVAMAIAYLGFDTTVIGKSGRTDILVDCSLGAERFHAIVDAKASTGGKVPESQINWPAIDQHRKQEEADYAAVVGEQFAGGNLLRFAGDFSIALIDTQSLVEVIRLQGRCPLPASDLRPLFSTAGATTSVVADIRQKSEAVERHWTLIADILELIDSFNRAEDPPIPTTGNLHAVLVSRALAVPGRRHRSPSEQDVRDAMSFLASRAIGILRQLEPETAGYRLTMSVTTALRRLGAVDNVVTAILDERFPTLMATSETLQAHPN